jgi:hypothetical protein
MVSDQRPSAVLANTSVSKNATKMYREMTMQFSALKSSNGDALA